MFTDRKHAAQLLIGRLQYALEKQGVNDCAGVIIVGLPRGGVPVAVEIGRALGCKVDILVSKKVRHPAQEELAVGAVSSCGIVVLDEEFEKFELTDELKLVKEQRTELLISETRAEEEKWRSQAGLTELALAQKVVVLADDGIATGMTVIAAIRSARKLGARLVLVAAPVMPIETYFRLTHEADAVVTRMIPWDFKAVSNYYQDFHQVGDEEVLSELKSVIESGKA